MNHSGILWNAGFEVRSVFDSLPPTAWPSAALPTAVITGQFKSALESLNQFGALPENWDSEHALPTTHEAISAGKVILNTFAALGIVPDVSPLRNGGVLFEYDHASFEFGIDVSPQGSGRLFLSLHGNDYESPAIPALAIAGAIQQLFSYPIVTLR